MERTWSDRRGMRNLRRVAQNLLSLEMEEASQNGINGSASSGGVESNSLRWSKDVGVTAFLLKFGLGMGTSTFFIFQFTFRKNNRNLKYDELIHLLVHL